MMRPFKHTRNNRIEAFCILSVLIGFVAVNFENIELSVFLSVFLIVVILLPILLALYYLVDLCLHCKHFCSADYRSNRSPHQIQLMRSRVLNKRTALTAAGSIRGTAMLSDHDQRTAVTADTAATTGYGYWNNPFAEDKKRDSDIEMTELNGTKQGTSTGTTKRDDSGELELSADSCGLQVD